MPDELSDVSPIGIDGPGPTVPIEPDGVGRRDDPVDGDPHDPAPRRGTARRNRRGRGAAASSRLGRRRGGAAIPGSTRRRPARLPPEVAPPVPPQGPDLVVLAPLVSRHDESDGAADRVPARQRRDGAEGHEGDRQLRLAGPEDQPNPLASIGQPGPPLQILAGIGAQEERREVDDQAPRGVPTLENASQKVIGARRLSAQNAQVVDRPTQAGLEEPWVNAELDLAIAEAEDFREPPLRRSPRAMPLPRKPGAASAPPDGTASARPPLRAPGSTHSANQPGRPPVGR